MKRRFMDFTATILIPDFPGETALWYARAYLTESGGDGSDSKHPEKSLANTLSKQVQTGREKRIMRERVGGLYRYFPASMPSTSDSNEEIVTQISLPAEELKDIDNLVTVVEKYHNRNEAISWLVMEGITANRAYLDKVADTRKQIEQLKRDVATT